MPALTVHNAEVSTAAVEIKTLTISGKQVTLAVFRQLQEEPLIASADGNLNGVPWGTVNYHPDKCGDDRRRHLHVVWQLGDELRRSRVNAPDWWADDYYSEFAGSFAQAVFCRNGHKRPEWIEPDMVRRSVHPVLPVPVRRSLVRDAERRPGVTELHLPGRGAATRRERPPRLRD